MMCAYNQVEGVYCSDHRRLLTDILRDEWGFDGAVISDWGATHDRVAAFRAGMDLEMPGSRGRFDREVREAVAEGRLDERFIDLSVDRLLTLIDRTTRSDRGALPADLHDRRHLHDRHHRLARRIAAAGAVLLKNDGPALPLAAGAQVAVIGELARTPRYQGTGSSQVTPTRLESLLDGLAQYTDQVRFPRGTRCGMRRTRRWWMRRWPWLVRPGLPSSVWASPTSTKARPLTGRTCAFPPTRTPWRRPWRRRATG